MKKSRNKTRAHFILFAEDTPFRSRKEVDRKKRGRRGYQKHRDMYEITAYNNIFARWMYALSPKR